MKIIKRNGTEVVFDIEKIERAISKANEAGTGEPELTARQIKEIAAKIERYCANIGRTLTVEEVQELVETYIMQHSAYETAKRYIRYRFTRNLVRTANTTDNQILRASDLTINIKNIL